MFFFFFLLTKNTMAIRAMMATPATAIPTIVWFPLLLFVGGVSLLGTDGDPTGLPEPPLGLCGARRELGGGE